ncbi:ATPase family AAA domain-containing protein 5 [Merluccius polli]|uniref:ATPase family AAA domain-containing protein 5 n=1 Tax=Merluccius polli TaxID=89951 RepID=A0AA47N352_MERPO|nr:ATPase family AAA domain-containing protein 5 [Merluccius polli]
MAGVVAMASVIEDFETRPCKKPRKDGDSPVAKTITNYFSPVPKPVDKHFSPPRSNNIMDYFSRKPPPSSSKEKAGPLEQSKENCQRPQSAEKPAGTAPLPGKPSQRPRKPKGKVTRKLQKNEAVNSADGGETAGEPVVGGGDSGQSAPSMLGSDTGALLAQLCAESLTVDKVSDVGDAETFVSPSSLPTRKDESRDGSLKSGKRAKVKPESNSTNSLSPVAPLKDKVKRGRPPTGNPRKKKTKEEKPPPPVPEGKEAELSLCDVSMEVNVDEDSRLNNSTVTVSFEDFLQSQGEGAEEEKVGDKAEAVTGVEEMETGGQLEVPLMKENTTSLQSISPRMLTVQAEVHASSMEPVKSAKRLASIFTKRKEADLSLSPQANLEHSAPPNTTTMPLKRKSNVVLQEGDLELAVVESNSTPKCSQAERKQFMAAFKRPGPDRAMAKPGKSQVKQKQPVGTAAEEEEKAMVEPPADQSDVPSATEENTRAEKKVTAKGKKKSSKGKKKVTLSSPPAASTPDEEPEAAVETTEATTTAAGAPGSSTLPVRRSKREVLPRQAPEAEGTTRVHTSRRQQRGEKADVPQDDPLQMSTPKSHHRSKHSMYKADLVCPPDENGSPIRIKFTRIQRNASNSRTDLEKPNALASKTPGASEKKTRAKRLVEKAKVIQQQSKKTVAEEKTSVRRSSRAQAIPSKVYVDDQDSLICMEDAQTTPSVCEKPPKKKSQQRLRSLNDVLGKATTQASKVAPLFQDRKSGRLSSVVSIFDEGSREGSENSQDDEACRARRDFLKSGLPDSFKKQIAKTTATREAYSLSCSSFQPVVHVLQTSQDCPLWSLPWPVSTSLCSVKDSWCLPSNHLLPLESPLHLHTEPAPRALCERGSGWRPELSDQVRQLLMEEVSSSDPSFPAQRFLTCFLKRRDHHLQQSTATETANSTPQSSAEPLGGKRKRVGEGETSGKLAKKQRSVRLKEDEEHAVPTPEPESPKRGGCGRGGRAQRRKKEKEEQELKAITAMATTPSPAPAQEGSVIVLDDSPLAGSNDKEDMVKEEVLWTEKYQPQHSSDVIGNTASVRKLHSWLKEWKQRADREERKKQKENRREEGSNDSDWDRGEDSSQDPEDMLCNTLLITGPTGVGKTAAVYACAQELGFKVFEVNSSSQRSGRLILSQLKEATQSHQVDIHGVNAHKPTFFNSYSTSSPTASTRPGSSPRKVNSPRRVVSSPRKHPQSPRGAKRASLAPTSLASFFKMGRPSANKEVAMSNKTTQSTAAPKKSTKPAEVSSKMKEPVLKTPPAVSSGAGCGGGGGGKESSAGFSGSGEEQSKKTATSLILFEEVDVIFDEDSGFLAAIKTFMTTTKRPVILTTSDPHFSTMFDGCFEEIHFKTPSMANVSSYLRLLCLTEDTRTDPHDVSTLLSLNSCDIRQSLLQLQFWTRSTGGHHRAIPQPDQQLDAVAQKHKEPPGASSHGASDPPDLPLWDTGCAESMLGLLNIQPQGSVRELLRCPLKETAACWELVADSRRRGVHLLYSNMHALLPLPVTQLPVSTLPPLQTPSQPCPCPMDLSTTTTTTTTTSSARPGLEAPPPQPEALQLAEAVDAMDDGSPVKVSKRRRKLKRLAERDPLHSDSDSEEDFHSLAKPAVTAQGEEGQESVCEAGAQDAIQPPLRMWREPLTPQQRVVSVPVSHCLTAIADFLDDMSYMDACSLSSQGCGGGRGQGLYAAQPRAQVKDGMVDMARLENPRASRVEAERAVEIQAAAEALSFQRCLAGVTKAQEEAQALGGGEPVEQAMLELSLPVASHQRGFSLTPHPPCQPKLLQKCREVESSLLSRGVFGTLGSRPELALEYLPTLRTICRSQQLKEQGKVKRRFLHYLDSIHLAIPRDTLQHLAGDFP